MFTESDSKWAHAMGIAVEATPMTRTEQRAQRAREIIPDWPARTPRWKREWFNSQSTGDDDDCTADDVVAEADALREQINTLGGMIEMERMHVTYLNRQVRGWQILWFITLIAMIVFVVMCVRGGFSQ